MSTYVHKTQKIGRPLKLPPKNAVEIILDIASRGCSEASIAHALHVDFQTWQRFRVDHPELKEAYEKARAREHDALVGVLFEKALAGDTVSALFLLKTRHGYRDNSTIIEDNRSVKIGVMLPQSLNADQYRQIINSVQEATDADECT
jgi:hypothetical protein